MNIIKTVHLSIEELSITNWMDVFRLLRIYVKNEDIQVFVRTVSKLKKR